MRMPNFYFIGIVLFMALSLSSCSSFLPESLDNLDDDSRFSQTEYNPVLGRNTLMSNNFIAGNASQPLNFSIYNIRRYNGEPAPELTEPFPVQVWKQPYLGDEKSIAEIESKRAVEYRPLFNIRQHNGSLEMWANARSAFVHTAPDSAYVFDVEVSNSGGRRYYKNLRLMPYRERPYEPSNQDAVTGNAKNPFIRLSRMQNVRGDRTSDFVGTGDVEVYFRKVVDENGNNIGEGNTVKFIFKDSLYNDINPDLLNETNWKDLIHGFDMEKTSNYVSYKVAYPLPLSEIVTKYTTTDGSKAMVDFKYSRLGFGNRREDSSFGLDFAIYEPGDWEIIMLFTKESPKFIND